MPSATQGELENRLGRYTKKWPGGWEHSSIVQCLPGMHEVPVPHKQGLVASACNPRTLWVELGGSEAQDYARQVQDQPWLYTTPYLGSKKRTSISQITAVGIYPPQDSGEITSLIWFFCFVSSAPRTCLTSQAGGSQRGFFSIP